MSHAIQRRGDHWESQHSTAWVTRGKIEEYELNKHCHKSEKGQAKVVGDLGVKICLWVGSRSFDDLLGLVLGHRIDHTVAIIFQLDPDPGIVTTCSL